MDQSLVYMEMCEKALKLQQIHQPKVGDFWFSGSGRHVSLNVLEAADVDCVRKRDMTNIYHLYADMVELSADCGFGAFWRERLNLEPFGKDPVKCDDGTVRLSYVWMPRQDQLQELVLHVFDGNYTRMFNAFVRYVESKPYCNYDSGEKRWLAFYLYHEKMVLEMFAKARKNDRGKDGSTPLK